MVTFVLALIGLGYTAGKLGAESLRTRKYRIDYDAAVKKRNMFLEENTASPEIIQQLSKDFDYSDVLDDINYIFDTDYSVSSLAELVRLGKKEFGKEKLYEDIILELRLAKIGKCGNIMHTSGVKFCEGVSYYKNLVRFYELLERYFAENGVSVERVEKKRNRSPIREMNFKEMMIV